MPERHLIFLTADHFEPESPDAVREWVKNYATMAERHRDADGRPPRHSWFCTGAEEWALEELSPACEKGLGEIEFHLHHGNDTSESLRRLIEKRKKTFVRFGALVCADDDSEQFAVMHGKWSLDNSRGAEHCGVNDELRVLRETGCFADFTFPAWGRMQPRKMNSIYYATDDPDEPKSYDDGTDVRVGGEATGDLMIFEGPGVLSGVPDRLARLKPLRILVDAAWLTCGVNSFFKATPLRIRRWVAANVHVKGRPEWVFVKVHTHGARRRHLYAHTGEQAHATYDHLEKAYNDGTEWALHYVTAREAYNIVKAAEAGMTGDQRDYRNFAIPPYRNSGKT